MPDDIRNTSEDEYFRVSGDTVVNGDRIGCQVVLRDVGNGDRTVTTASAVFRRVG